MKLRTVFVVLFFTAIFSIKVKAQTTTELKDTLEAGKSFTAAYPVLFYFPETRLGFGAAGIRTFYLSPITEKYRRPSNVSVGLAYTLEKQILIFNEYKLFFNDSKSRIFGELGYYDYFYYFYGLGNQSKLTDEESYDVRYPRFKMTYLHQIANNLYVGPRYHYDDYHITQLDPEGTLLNEEINGFQGGIISNLGLVAHYDTRDNVFFPEKGMFIKSRFILSHNATGASYDYIKWTSDMRFFIKVADQTVLGIHNYIGGGTSGIPFQELSLVGGPRRGRGLTAGRFRGQYCQALQTELRFPIYWRFSGTSFIGVYRVSMDGFKTVIDDPKLTYGFGLRFLLNKKDRLNIRTDFAFSEDGSKFYFTIGEAF